MDFDFFRGKVAPPDAKPGCGCQHCYSGPAIMILCPVCGNKRCPKATHHDHACTGSNEPGQPGSSYGTPMAPPTPSSLKEPKHGV